jgi:hypothetical protein
MASDGQPVKIPAVSLVRGSLAPTVGIQRSGKVLPQSGKAATAAATGEVVGELPADEFEALARSVGISGVIVDKHA